MRKSITSILISLLTATMIPAGLSAQESVDSNDLYTQALTEYNNGHFERCEATLNSIIPHVKGITKTSAYKLMTLCKLQQDDTDGAKEYAAKLLKNDPYFTPAMDDPQRFVTLITSSKSQGVTITTASQRAETLEESPVPVTVITEEMIRMSGAQTLRDLICLFVPTITRVEGMEANLCMRGVVGNTQEDILIMLDGHRLNSGATNAEGPDFRNSLNKIKQIEVLRGPASSLYGNVALMAVVNIITKKGAELDGAQIGARIGSYNTWGADAVYGKGNLNGELMAWGSVYASNGEKVMQDGTTHYIDSYRDKPAYDIGLKARWGDASLTFTHQHSKPVPFYNQITMAPYSYDEYTSIDDSKPGASRNTTHAFVDYNHSWQNWALSASIYGGMERTSFYNALGDQLTPEAILQLYPTTDPKTLEYTAYAMRMPWLMLSWEDFSAGVNVNMSHDYKLGTQHGSVLIGAQADVFDMTSGKCSQGYTINCEIPVEDPLNRMPTSTFNNIIGLHTEHTLSGYMQLKNYFTKRLIFNGGLRFDSKKRYDERINTLSPRLALIWMPTPSSNIKISYAHSFVDAPYLYRASKLSLYGSSVHLEPQKNDAFQLSGSKTWPALHLTTELNFYYNRVRDLCIFSYSGLKRNDISGAFSTAEIDICGAEAVVEYKTAKTFVHLNMSYKYPIEMKRYSSYKHKIGNEPAFMANIVANRTIWQSEKVGSINLHANLHYQTDAEMEVNYMMGDVNITNEHCPAQALFNMGADWKIKRFHVFFDAYNLFSKNYRIGAQLQSWIPAQGTKLVGKLVFTL